MAGVPINPIIWFLKEKVGTLTFIQTRPKSSGNLPIALKNVNMPWHGIKPDLKSLDKLSKLIPNVVHELLPIPPTKFTLSGVTKDSTGAILGSCVVNVFRTSDNLFIGTTTSDSVTGAYSYSGVGQQDHFEVSYKAGATDVAGTTKNNLRGA